MADKKFLNKEMVSWRAAEYEHLEKDIRWYGIVAGATIILLIFAFLQKNFFFAVFIVLGGIMLMSFGKNRPQVFDFRVTEKGVGVGNKNFYEYDALENFSFRNRPGRLDEIILKKKALVNPFVRIPIDSKMAERAKKILEGKLPEIEYQESLITLFSEWLGF